MTKLNIDFTRPIALRPDNFTPLSRTPWGGQAIAQFFKDEIVPGAVGQKIGEAWEFSCDAKFPSWLADADITLTELVAEFPEPVLGPMAGAVDPFCEILVKMVNAAQPLSLQIHPYDSDINLDAASSGKPESWYILHAEPGAGIYLGFNQSLTKDQLRYLLSKDDKAKDILQFVAVNPGDYFEVEPGVPHAIGPGLTLLEPQRIRKGKSGMTFRMWDWGRRFNAAGELDYDSGQPRELHIDAALRLADPEVQVGEAFVDSCRRHGKHQKVNSCLWTAFPANPYYQLHIVDSAEVGHCTMLAKAGYGALTMIAGEFLAAGVRLVKGQSALLPYDCFPLDVNLGKHTRMAIVVPAYAGFKVT
jgi:mannose-6-phosphate isomerase